MQHRGGVPDRGTDAHAANRAKQCTYGYEPPRVEQVLTPADFEREMLYAGAVTHPPFT